MFGTLADIRNELRVRLGLPERGDSGDTRLNTMINMALRHMWSEMPKALLSKDHRFMLQPALTNKTAQFGTTPLTKANEIFYDLEHPRTLLIKDIHIKAVVTQTSDYEGDTLLATDGTWRGRTIEVKVNDRYYYRKIQKIWTSVEPVLVTITNVDGATHQFNKFHQYIILDDPLPFDEDQMALTFAQGGTESPYEYRLLCEEYPYPDDVQQVVDVIVDPDTSPHPLVESTFQADLTNYRSTIGFRSEGRPETYCRGSFFQLESPNYKPAVDLVKAEGLPRRWGYIGSLEQNYSVAGVERNAGPAGTFQYLVVHVWGRRPDYLAHFKADAAVTQKSTAHKGIQNRPFYRSGPSKESETIITFWGSDAIEVKTPNVDYVYGYGSLPDLNSHLHFGYEKYIFRKRISTTEFTPRRSSPPNPTHSPPPTGAIGPNAIVTNVEADSIYYLLAITPGYQTEFYDNGTFDPPDRSFSLEAFSGHFHIRFDRQPTEEKPVLMRTFSRPPLLRYDTDTPRIPSECYDALYSLTASYLVGDRDGEPARKSLYFQEYQAHLKRLRKTYNVAGHQVGSFGNGLSPNRRFSGPRRNRPITEKL